jgi:hypothetical protein
MKIVTGSVQNGGSTGFVAGCLERGHSCVHVRVLRREETSGACSSLQPRSAAGCDAE